MRKQSRNPLAIYAQISRGANRLPRASKRLSCNVTSGVKIPHRRRLAAHQLREHSSPLRGRGPNELLPLYAFLEASPCDPLGARQQARRKRSAGKRKLEACDLSVKTPPTFPY
jgi:hypothetical protein